MLTLDDGEPPVTIHSPCPPNVIPILDRHSAVIEWHSTPGRRSVRRTPAPRSPADSALTGAAGGPNSHLPGEPGSQAAGWLAIQREPSRLRIARCETSGRCLFTC